MKLLKSPAMKSAYMPRLNCGESYRLEIQKNFLSIVLVQLNTVTTLSQTNLPHFAENIKVLDYGLSRASSVSSSPNRLHSRDFVFIFSHVSWPNDYSHWPPLCSVLQVSVVVPYTRWRIFSRTSCWVTEHCCTSRVSCGLLFIHLSIFFAFPSVASVICYYLDNSLLICPIVSSPSPGIYTGDYFCLCVKHGTWLYDTASYLISPHSLSVQFISFLSFQVWGFLWI